MFPDRSFPVGLVKFRGGAVGRGVRGWPNVARAILLESYVSYLGYGIQPLTPSWGNMLDNAQQYLTTVPWLAILIIAHDLAVVGLISDRTAVMYLGRIVELADAAALFARPHHPYTEALFSAVPDIGSRRERILLQSDIPSPLVPPSGCPFRTRCRYAEPACADAAPPLAELSPGHFAACRRPELTLASPLPTDAPAFQTS